MPTPDQTSRARVSPGGKLGMFSRVGQPGTAAPIPAVSAPPVPEISSPAAVLAPAAQGGNNARGSKRLHDERFTFRMGSLERKRFKTFERYFEEYEEKLPFDRSMLLRALLAIVHRQIGNSVFMAELIAECKLTPPGTPGTGAPRSIE